MRPQFMSALRIARHSMFLLLAGCPLLLDDNFSTLPAEATGGVTGSSGGQAGEPARAGAAAGGSSASDPARAGAAAGGFSANPSGGAGATTGGSVGQGSSGGAPDAGGSGNAASCATGATRGPNGHCYTIGTTSSGWPEARSNCRGLGNGWDLATVLDDQDSAFLSRILTTEGWIGADDTNGTAVWRWVRDGAEFWQGGREGSALNDAYVNWSPDQPNDDGGTDCVRILPSALWAAADCGSGFPAVCEGPAN